MRGGAAQKEDSVYMESQLQDAIDSVEGTILGIDEECAVTIVDTKVRSAALDILYACLSALRTLHFDEYGGDEYNDAGEWLGPVEMRIMQEIDEEEGIGDYFGPGGELRVSV